MIDTEDKIQVTELGQQVPTTLNIPVFKSKGNRDYIPYSGVGGKLDNFPNELEALKRKSVWHGSVLSQKALQVAGKGFIVADNKEDQETLDFLENINEDEDANELLEQWSKDILDYGGYCALVTWSSDWSKINSIESVPFSKIRIGKLNEFGKIDRYYYSFDWVDSRQPRTAIPAFNPKGASKTKIVYDKAIKGYDVDTINRLKLEGNTQLYYYKPKEFFYYPLPSYIQCISAIEGDVNADVYNKAAMKNGFKSGVAITFKGIKDPARRNENTRTLIKNSTGAINSGTVLPFYVDKPEDAPEFNEFTGQKNAAEAKIISDENRQKILSGHSVTSPLLVGIAQPGALGNREEILNAQELFYTTAIQPVQFKITKFMNKVMKINGLAKVSIDKLTVVVDTVGSVDDSSDNNNEI